MSAPSLRRLYKVDAVLVTVGCYGGNFVVARTKAEAISKCRERYKGFPIAEYTARSLGEVTGDVLGEVKR
jgi:hypothetical protein